MLSDEEKEAIKNLRLNVTNVGFSVYDGTTSLFKMRDIQIVLNLIEKQSKEIEELKKELDLDNECEIALNNKVMNLEKETEELKKEYERVRAGRNWLSEHISAQIATPELFDRLVEENYISKDKIKAKIEEIEKYRM